MKIIEYNDAYKIFENQHKISDDNIIVLETSNHTEQNKQNKERRKFYMFIKSDIYKGIKIDAQA